MKHIISLAVLGFMVSTSAFIEARGRFIKQIRALESVFCNKGSRLKIPKHTQKRFEESDSEYLAIDVFNYNDAVDILSNNHVLSKSKYLGVISFADDGTTVLSVFDKAGNMITQAPITVSKESEQISENLHSLMVIPQEPQTLSKELAIIPIGSEQNNSEKVAYEPCTLMDVMHLIASGTVVIVAATVVAGGAGVLLLCGIAAAGAGAFMAIYAFGIGLCIPLAVGSYISSKFD